MSKQAGFVPPTDESITPSAPPSYEEAMRPQPAQMPMPHLYPSAVPQQMPMPMPQPTSMPMPQPMPTSQPMATQQSARHVMPLAPQTQHTTITIPAPVVVSSSPSAARGTCLMHCPHCSTSVLTTTVEEHSCLAHLCCCMLFWIGCFLCSCLPYCMDSFKMVKHKCPNCGGYLGTYKAL